MLLHAKKCLGLCAGLATLAACGCAATPSTIRGQSPAAAPAAVVVPDDQGPIIGTAPGYGERKRMPGRHHHDFKMFAGYRNPAYADGNGWYDGSEPNNQLVYETGGGHGHGHPGCPACNGGLECPDGGCPHCGCGCDHGCPDHYYTYSYKWPKNLVYPQPVLPAGMVQYPYYTLRGPTDFFMK